MTNDYIGYSGDDILKKLNNYNSKITTNYYNGDKSEFKIFIKNLFESANTPYLFESDLVAFINTNYQDTFPLEIEELIDISILFFEDYLKDLQRIDSTAFRLFYNTSQTVKTPQGNGYSLSKKYSDKSIHLFRTFILENDIEGYIKFIISKSSPQSKFYTIGESVLIIFESYDNFRKILDSYDTKKVNEFKLFMDKLEQQNYQYGVEFNFQEIELL